MNIETGTPLCFGDIDTFLTHDHVKRIIRSDKIAFSLGLNIEYYILQKCENRHDPKGRVPPVIQDLFEELVKRVKGNLRPKPKLVCSNEFWQLPEGALEKPKPIFTLVRLK
mgnify:CR=1 FL=1